MNPQIILSTRDAKVFVDSQKVCKLHLYKYCIITLEIQNITGHFYLKYGNEYIRTDGVLVNTPWLFELQALARDEFKFLDTNAQSLIIDGYSVFSLKKYTFKDKLGVIHWGGDHHIFEDDDFLVEGAKQIKNMGVKHLKIYAGKRADKTYLTEYSNKSPHLVIQQPNFQETFKLGFETIVLVSHSNVGKSSTYWKYSNEMTDENLHRERMEMYNLATELGKVQGVKFIVTNWEGDCMINRDKTPKVYQNMIRWVQARQDGIDAARSSNVSHGLEVNFVRQSLFNEPSVTTEVLPFVKTDYVSYSAYDFVDYENLVKCIELIKSKTLATLIIGEFGSPVNMIKPSESTNIINAVIRAVEDCNVQLCFYWQIYDNEFDSKNDPKGFGLIKPSGKVTGVWAYLKFL
jgi:hypothetical protein